ncbi:MAG TPA: hypothetical protein VFV96_12940 [Verrucomicrobiae bacterium]|nr:hypothetical protein [Verrucomicrobiae bacterium]
MDDHADQAKAGNVQPSGGEPGFTIIGQQQADIQFPGQQQRFSLPAPEQFSSRQTPFWIGHRTKLDECGKCRVKGAQLVPNGLWNENAFKQPLKEVLFSGFEQGGNGGGIADDTHAC